jgi:oligopeptide/dipeptide ABC transporter ATP-binding protein
VTAAASDTAGSAPREDAAAPLLEVTDLAVRFGPVRALSGVSFRVERGEFYGVVGESGSGKSVTARAVLGLLGPSARVTSGSVRLDGEELLGAAPARLRQLRGDTVGLVFQDALAALDPVYTIGDQLVEALRAHQRIGRREARERAVGLLDEVGIPDPEDRLGAYPHQLSGGQRQRAVIATALIADPKLIIADEPTTALDVTVQAQILNLLRRIRDTRGASIVLITHDLGVIAETCDRVAVFYGGVIVEEAPVLLLFTAPQHPYTEALLRSVPRLGDPTPTEPIPGAPIQVREDLDACPFAPRCPHAVDDCLDGVPGEVSLDGRRHRCLRPWDSATVRAGVTPPAGAAS